MKNSLLIPTACLLLFISFKAKSQSPVSSATALVLQQKLDSCVNAYDVPGISATILFPGNKYWNGAAGVNDIYTMDPMDTTYLFYQASVTKMFVATIVFQMIEEGLLSLDDTVGDFLPAIATIPSDTKIRYLLNHRSGIYNFLGQTPTATETWFSYPDSIWNPILAIETYNAAPTFAQGSSFAYSNTNYMLLGLIIEAISGNDFATELSNRILIPYDLNQTFFPPVDSIAGPQVTGWTSFASLSGPYDTDAAPILNDCSTSMFYTSGAMVSYPKDIAKFTRLLFSGEILNDTTLTLMKTCTNVTLGGGCNGYGYGAMRYSFAGKTYFGHAGDLSGFTQLTIHHLEDSITLCISINRNNAPRGPIALALLNTLEDALTVGLDEQVQESTLFSVYPNPANDQITVRLTDANAINKIQIYNHLGQIVYTNDLVGQSSPFIVSTEHLMNGLYFVTVSNENFSQTEKIIVNH